MIAHAWSVLCNKVIVDRETNNMSLDVIEQIYFQLTEPFSESQVITIPYDIQLVSMWYKSDVQLQERQRSRVRLIAPDGEALGMIEVNLDLTTAKRARVQTRFNAFPTKGNGVYFFVVEKLEDQSWSEVARLPLDVTLADVPPPAEIAVSSQSVR